MTSTVITGPDGPVEALVRGDGDPVVLLPSLGRGATVLSLSNAGHAILPERPEEVAKMLLDWLDPRRS